MLNYEIVKLSITRVLIILILKRSLKITIMNKTKWVKIEEKKSTSLKTVSLLQNKSNVNITILALG